MHFAQPLHGIGHGNITARTRKHQDYKSNGRAHASTFCVVLGGVRHTNITPSADQRHSHPAQTRYPFTQYEMTQQRNYRIHGRGGG